MTQCVNEIEDLKLYKHYTGIIKDNQFKIFNGNSHYLSVKNSKSYPLDCFELVGIQDRDGWITTANRVNLSEFNKEKYMEIDKNDPFIQVLEYLLSTEYENTITKLELEEKEYDNMKKEIESMKTLKACIYLEDHKDEYLVAKDDENLELHIDERGFYTTFKSVAVMQNKLTLDYPTLHQDWVIPTKKRLYRISDYIRIDNDCYLIHSEILYLNKKNHDEIIEKRTKMLKDELGNLKYDAVFVKSEMIFDFHLNVITQMS